jgi:hypothetical protein
MLARGSFLGVGGFEGTREGDSDIGVDVAATLVIGRRGFSRGGGPA